jgi:hypothetical protein
LSGVAMAQSWYELAARAESELAVAAPYGSVMAQTDAVAARLGTTRQALRNYMAARRFAVGALEDDPQAARALADMSAAMVAVHSRWAKYDRAGALEHAKLAVRERLPARVIVAAEAAARAAAGEQRGTMLDRALTEAAEGLPHTLGAGRAGGAVAQALERFGIPRLDFRELQPTPASLPLAWAAGVRQVLRWDAPVVREWPPPGGLPTFFTDRGQTGPFEVVGVIEIPLGAIADTYRRGAKGVFARAAVAAALYPLVVVLLPDGGAVREFESALPPLPLVRLGLDPADSLPGGHLLGRGMGGIVAMAADRFGEGWAGWPMHQRRPDTAVPG